ncbi:MAG: zinc-dependent metalloprotease, partial [Propionibacteriaceae bacterium]|nr:zinc-dependent metalloprotease [Propionibacteriaceae bacterium]
PDNIDAFSDGLDADPGDVLLVVALREDARQRLFAQVGWLGPQLHALVQHYAREIRIDRDALERALEEQFQRPVDPSDAESAQLAMAASLFSPTRTPEQADILERLETLLALVEGWVDEVVAQVTAQRMPAAAGLIEMMRRRRASGGPAEQAWMTLVGMELRPRRARDAANLWAALRARDGGPARDAVWGHPDLMPKASDLDDPLGFADRSCQGESASELDEALAKILDEEGFGEDGR